MLAFGRVDIEYTREVIRKIRGNGIKKRRKLLPSTLNALECVGAMSD